MVATKERAHWTEDKDPNFPPPWRAQHCTRHARNVESSDCKSLRGRHKLETELFVNLSCRSDSHGKTASIIL